jgi:hypothetical protein
MLIKKNAIVLSNRIWKTLYERAVARFDCYEGHSKVIMSLDEAAESMSVFGQLKKLIKTEFLSNSPPSSPSSASSRSGPNYAAGTDNTLLLGVLVHCSNCCGSSVEGALQKTVEIQLT